MIKTTIPVGDRNPNELMEALTARYEHQVSRIDGVRVSYEEGWVQARPSNTEPIFRVYAEAKSLNFAQKILTEMLDHIAAISATQSTYE